MDVHSVTASVEPLPQELCKELDALCRGTVLFYGNPRLKIMAFYSWHLTKTFFSALRTTPPFSTVTWYQGPRQLYAL